MPTAEESKNYPKTVSFQNNEKELSFLKEVQELLGGEATRPVRQSDALRYCVKFTRDYLNKAL